MNFVCGNCGKTTVLYDQRPRKYCADCSKSGKRHAGHFKERRKKDPVVDAFARTYGKLHSMWKHGGITKIILDEWRNEAKIKKHEAAVGIISQADFANWCDMYLAHIRGQISNEKRNEPSSNRNKHTLKKATTIATAELDTATGLAPHESNEGIRRRFEMYIGKHLVVIQNAIEHPGLAYLEILGKRVYYDIRTLTERSPEPVT